MKLILTVELENDALDGPTLKQHLRYALDTVGTTLAVRDLDAGRMIVAPPGSPYPIEATFRLEYRAEGPR